MRWIVALCIGVGIAARADADPPPELPDQSPQWSIFVDWNQDDLRGRQEPPDPDSLTAPSITMMRNDYVSQGGFPRSGVLLRAIYQIEARSGRFSSQSIGVISLPMRFDAYGHVVKLETPIVPTPGFSENPVVIWREGRRVATWPWPDTVHPNETVRVVASDRGDWGLLAATRHLYIRQADGSYDLLAADEPLDLALTDGVGCAAVLSNALDPGDPNQPRKLMVWNQVGGLICESGWEKHQMDHLRLLKDCVYYQEGVDGPYRFRLLVSDQIGNLPFRGAPLVLSHDLSHALMEEHGSPVPGLTPSYYDISSPLTPRLLWVKNFPEAVRQGTAVSEDGGLVALQCIPGDSGALELMVFDASGAVRLHHVHGSLERPTFGLTFVSPTELMEGLDPEDPYQQTVGLSVYRVGK